MFFTFINIALEDFAVSLTNERFGHLTLNVSCDGISL